MKHTGISDTSPEAREFLDEGYRRMSPTEKLKRVASLNRALAALQKARIRAQYGEISEEEMRMRLGALRRAARRWSGSSAGIPKRGAGERWTRRSRLRCS